MPFFASKAAGDDLLEIMQEHPFNRMTVLCGHTHSHGEFRPLKNLVVKTGEAEYGWPRINEVLEIR